jgi:NIMA-interacting peptidyl-prolyl cis-trans isomerase 1
VTASASASATAAASATATASAPAPDWITAQHVLIAYKGAKNAPKTVTRTKAEARALAEKVRDQARAGTSFEDLVAKYSEDPGSKDRLGSVGKFTRDKMTKAFSDAAFALKVDQVSDVVETPFGFHVIKRNQ